MKRLAVVALILTLLMPHLAATATVVEPPFLPGVGQRAPMPWYEYENQVYLYGFSLPGEFFPLDRLDIEQQLQQQEPGESDFLYDIQRWQSMDGRITFEFQLKKPSYASLEEEVERLPEYLTQLQADLAEQDIHDVRFSHDRAILHDTPAGTMLEVPVEFDITSNTGHVFTIHSIYYDYYDANNEYIFYLQGVESSYEELSELINRIAQTIHITPIVLK